jgi:hypothetical protein
MPMRAKHRIVPELRRRETRRDPTLGCGIVLRQSLQRSALERPQPRQQAGAHQRRLSAPAGTNDHDESPTPILA